ncbi:hypothetical protein CEXT_128291 [Caerostris extrusa]|uniref:Uncharacterized protein n=1 Tax=Caerostris extrusa TaxID=172846 RepID=A0AAV4XR34_CAEEX|nr:hypothetical protein CEXT_128291 [Caerostris extrusa]
MSEVIAFGTGWEKNTSYPRTNSQLPLFPSVIKRERVTVAILRLNNIHLAKQIKTNSLVIHSGQREIAKRKSEASLQLNSKSVLEINHGKKGFCALFAEEFSTKSLFEE